MKTYSEKLKDPRWAEFREMIMLSRGHYCEVCGPDAGENTQVHHRRYIWGREPWEYEENDVIVLCEECHESIHRCETKWRDMIRAMPPFMITEFDSMAETFHGMNPETIQTWAAYCKNEARKLKGFKTIQEGFEY